MFRFGVTAGEDIPEQSEGFEKIAADDLSSGASSCRSNSWRDRRSGRAHIFTLFTAFET
jgi:hypothetical protein